MKKIAVLLISILVINSLLSFSSEIPNIKLIEIRLNNEKIESNERFLLIDNSAYHFGLITIDYNEAKRFKMKYELDSNELFKNYKLEYILYAIDTSWIEGNDCNEIVYTNIPDGSNVLELRLIENGETKYFKKLGIKVIPPFWRTGIFRIIIFLMVLNSIVVTPILINRNIKLKRRSGK